MILIFLMRSPLKWNATQFRLSKTPEHSARYFFKPCLACNVLSPSLLTCLHNFAHVSRWTDLENVAIRQRRVPADELYSMIHVPRLKDENAAELFFGFRIGTICRCPLCRSSRTGSGRFPQTEVLRHRPSFRWREDARRMQGMCRTWRFARSQSDNR